MALDISCGAVAGGTARSLLAPQQLGNSSGQGVTSCFEGGAQLTPPKITRQHPKLGQPTRATPELNGALRQCLVCVTRSRWQANEGSPVSVLHLPGHPTAPAPSRQPSAVQLPGGCCTISTPPPALSFFPLSIQCFRHTQNRVLGTHRLRGDYGYSVKRAFPACD